VVAPVCRLVRSLGTLLVVNVVVLQKTLGGGIPLRRASRVTSFSAQAEDLIEEQDQSQHIPFGQPPHLAFPDHVHYLVSLDRPPGAVKGSEPLAGVDPSFDRSMILFHDVVQVRTGTTATPTTQFALLL
jgi:hypothetical protein